MWRHYAGNWMAVVGQLERVKWIVIAAADGIGSWSDVKIEIERFQPWLWKEISSMPFSESLKKQADRLEAVLRPFATDDAEHRSVHLSRIPVLIDELAANIQTELKQPLFLMVPAARRRFYGEDDAALFGHMVADAFPESTPEIAEAGRCFALARWTASVFHLMRALELALHKWATQLGVTQFSAIELENWKNILDAAEKKVRALEQLPKSPQKDAELQYYGETLGQYRSIKDAWRNHVAHARVTYNEAQATSILNHCSEFMRLLAAKP